MRYFLNGFLLTFSKKGNDIVCTKLFLRKLRTTFSIFFPKSDVAGTGNNKLFMWPN